QTELSDARGLRHLRSRRSGKLGDGSAWELPRAAVGMEYVIQNFDRRRLMIIHDGADDQRNVRKRDAFVDEGMDSLIVGGIHRRRQCPAGAQRAISQRNARKAFEIRSFKMQRRELRQIEWRQV